MSLYACGCNHRPTDKDKKRDDYTEWKYTQGFDGDRSLCYDCWKKK